MAAVIENANVAEEEEILDPAAGEEEEEEGDEEEKGEEEEEEDDDEPEEEEEDDDEPEEEEVEEEEEGEDDDEPEGQGGGGEEGAVSKPVKKTAAKTTGQKKIVVTGVEMLEATKKPVNINASYDEDSDADSEEGENYLQKFDSDLRDDFILNYHPESRTHNYEEVKALARVTRDGRGIIVDPMHKTLPFLTKYEMTRVLGQRAKQLDAGAKPFVKIPLNVIDGYPIAKLELEQKKIPFIIKRPFPNGGIEYWHVYDLEVL